MNSIKFTTYIAVTVYTPYCLLYCGPFWAEIPGLLQKLEMILQLQQCNFVNTGRYFVHCKLQWPLEETHESFRHPKQLYNSISYHYTSIQFLAVKTRERRLKHFVSVKMSLSCKDIFVNAVQLQRLMIDLMMWELESHVAFLLGFYMNWVQAAVVCWRWTSANKSLNRSLYTPLSPIFYGRKCWTKRSTRSTNVWKLIDYSRMVWLCREALDL